MKTRQLLISACLFGAFTFSLAQAQNDSKKMKILVHVTKGAENPTIAALAFLVARTAVEEGHQVSLFLAGDAVPLVQDQQLDNIAGLGTGKLREHYQVIIGGGGKFYLSGMSSKARGVTDAHIDGKPATFATPNTLLKLALESDRMFVY